MNLVLPTVDTFAEVVRLVQERQDLFVRFSRGPEHDGRGECSRDYESGLDMPGLSVATIVPEAWWTRPAEEWIARRLCQYEWLADEQDRFPWLLTGSVVGNGPDHEPLVADVEPVARVGRPALISGRELYFARFDVAADSRQ